MQKNLNIKTLIVGSLQTNCYLLSDNQTNKTIIIDPGDDAEYISNTLRDIKAIPCYILATHGHFDHILAVMELQLAYKIPFLIHKKDDFLLTRMQETARYFLGFDVINLPPTIDGNLKENDEINIGDTIIKVFETPGHTPGSICLYQQEDKILFSGDTIFAGGIGRTDFIYSSSKLMQNSISKILDYPKDTNLYPGHGNKTSIAQEFKHLINSSNAINL